MFKTWAAKSGHLGENLDAIPGFHFLIFEVARVWLGPGNGLRATHLSLDVAALILTSGFLRGHLPSSCDLGDKHSRAVGYLTA